MQDEGKEKFVAWLRTHAFEHVGNRNDPRACVYARFLMDQGEQDVSVGVLWHTTNVNTLEKITTRSNPEWLTRFIQHLDRSSGSLPTVSGVTGAEAMKFLEFA